MLLGGYLIIFILLGIDPYDRTVWLAENIPIMLIVMLLLATYRQFRFSNIAYVMMTFLIYLHTIGGHFTFERVPFDWVTDLIGAERNHYDRVAHFTVGFYAFAVAEILLVNKLTNSRFILFTYPILFIMSLAGIYELFEWIYAVSADAEAGIAVLGSQGDIWDAQKDILADTLGSISAMGIFIMTYRDKIRNLS